MTDSKISPYAPLKVREFDCYLIGRFCYNFAFQMQNMILGWKLYELTNDKLALGLIGLAEAIPFILFSLFAGYIADTFGRKNIIRISLFGLMTSTCLLFLLLSNKFNFVNSFGLTTIYVVIGITGICRTFITASYKALYAQVLPKNLYAAGTTWDATSWQISAVAGPALGGFLYAWIGIDKAFIFIFFIFILAYIGFDIISKKPLVNKDREPIFQSLKEGLKFVTSTPILLGAITLDLFAVLFGGAVALLPVIVKDILHSGPESLGILRTAPFVGAAIMGFLLAHYHPFKKAGRNLFLSVALFGVCMIAFAFSKNIYLSFGLLFMSGIFDSVSVVIRSAIFQIFTPDKMRGRVSSVSSMFITSSNEIGAFESGLAAKILGTVPSIVFGGCMTLFVVGSSALGFKKLRNLDLTKHQNL